MSGRPRTDRIELLERAVEVMLVEPLISANRLQRRIGARRKDVRRIHQALRRLQASPTPEYDTAAPPERVPNPPSAHGEGSSS